MHTVHPRQLYCIQKVCKMKKAYKTKTTSKNDKETANVLYKAFQRVFERKKSEIQIISPIYNEKKADKLQIELVDVKYALKN